MVDHIEIRGLRGFGRHGVLASEQEQGQVFVVDVDLEVDLSVAARSDMLHDTVDYGALSSELAAAIEATRFDLIESLAGHLADIALDDPHVHSATVRVAKPKAPVPTDVDHVAVTVTRVRS